MLSRIKGLFRRRDPDRVVFDDEVVVRTLPDGTEERLLWRDLGEVSIVTTDEGPFAPDVFWVLLAVEGGTGCLVPQEAEGSHALLARLQDLPGFDDEAVIRAMGSTENNRFICWRRPGFGSERPASPRGGGQQGAGERR